MPEVKLDFVMDTPAPAGTQDLLARVAECCARTEGVTLPCAACLTFTDDAGIQQLNREYRRVDASTDVLSFPLGAFAPARTAGQNPRALRALWDADARACMLGDIVISLDHARAQAEEYGHSVQRELAYLTAHAMFHLMGYDHMKSEDKERMRAMEEKALKSAGASRVTDDELIEMARKAMQNSYSPYSKFKVGACLLANDGRTFTGCNVENASFGATNCAERTALFKAVSEGARAFVTLAICTEKALAWPCGICRQALNEFAPDLRVITCCGEERAQSTLNEILPRAFGPNNGTNDYIGKD